MVATISLRPIADDDRPLLYRIFASTRDEEVAMVDWPSDAARETFLTQQFHAQHTYYQAEFSNAQYDVILVDGQPAGRLYVDRREDEIRIIDIALLPEFRGRGIGGGLIEDLMEEAAAAGKPLRICVERINRAMTLYVRLGFREIEDLGAHFLMEWSPSNPPDEE